MCLDPDYPVGQEPDGPQFCWHCPDPKGETIWMYFDETHAKHWFPDFDHLSYHSLMKHPEVVKSWGDDAHLQWLKTHYQKKLGL
jgi:hypothetical protein